MMYFFSHVGEKLVNNVYIINIEVPFVVYLYIMIVASVSF